MFIESPIAECEFTGRKYDTYVNGGYSLVMNENGRVFDVKQAGPEYLAERRITPLTQKEAAEKLSVETRMTIKAIRCC